MRRAAARSDVLPEIREWERTSATVLSAYVLPRIGDYLQRFEAMLGANGLAHPALLHADQRRLRVGRRDPDAAGQRARLRSRRRAGRGAPLPWRPRAGSSELVEARTT